MGGHKILCCYACLEDEVRGSRLHRVDIKTNRTSYFGPQRNQILPDMFVIEHLVSACQSPAGMWIVKSSEWRMRNVLARQF